MLFDTANLAYWIFLGVGIFFFMLVIVSGGGEDQDIDADVDADMDVNVDTDVDVDADIDADTDADVNTHFNSSLFSALSWLGIGKAPLLILLAIDFSAWGVIGWFLNVIIGEISGKIPSGLLGLAIFLISLIISLSFGKLLSNPLGKMFAQHTEDISGNRLVGCIGTVISKEVPYLIAGKIAQVDVLDNAGNLVSIEACLPDWAKVVPHRGQEVLIIERNKHCYIAIAKDTSDQDKWFNQINN